MVDCLHLNFNHTIIGGTQGLPHTVENAPSVCPWAGALFVNPDRYSLRGGGMQAVTSGQSYATHQSWGAYHALELLLSLLTLTQCKPLSKMI